MPSSHRGVLLAWGLGLGLATAAWGQGEFSLTPAKEKPAAPAREGSKAPARESAAVPAKEDSSEASTAEKCQPLQNAQAGKLAAQGGEALESRRYIPARKLITEALKLQPEAGELRLALAAALARVGEVEAASREYEAFLEACPKHAKGAVVRKLLAEYHHTKGAQAFAASTVDELAKSVFATEEGTEALCDESQLPDEARAAYDEGVRLLNSGKASRAVTSFRHVLELEPRSVMAQLMLGSAYAQTNNPDEAAQAYMTFLTLCPDHPRAQEVRQLLNASGVDEF
jgi:Flp pilus assembly protein TadD